MFKELFKKLLFEVLGGFIEDFSAGELNISSWNGVMLKNNLQIKKDAVELIYKELGLNLNLEINEGVIGTFLLSIPWSKIWKEPCQVKLEDIHIVCSVKNDYNHAMNLKVQQEQKKSTLIQLENKTKKALMASKAKVKGPSKLRKMMQIILENLNLEIRNVHIRIEDNGVSLRDRKLAMGVVFKSLTLFPTDSNFQKSFVNPEERMKQKLSYSQIMIQGFGFYFDTIPKEMNSLELRRDITSQEFIQHSELILRNLDKKEFLRSFILKPTDVCVKKTSYLSEIDSDKNPALKLDISLSKLYISCEDVQYKRLQFLIHFIKWCNQTEEHFCYRPSFSCRPDSSENVRVWWKYVFDSVLLHNRLHKERINWEYIVGKSIMRREYITIYKLKILYDIEQQAGPKKKALLTKENQAFYIQRGGEKVKTDYKGILAMMNEYELQLSLEEIIIFRQVANSQLLNREAVNQFISSLLEEPKSPLLHSDANTEQLAIPKTETRKEKKGFFSRVVGTVLFRQERKAEPQALSIDDMVLNDIDDFIKNNNIFLAPDEAQENVNKFKSSLSIEVEEILLKLNNRASNQNTKFCFLYTKIDRFRLKLDQYARVVDAQVGIDSLLAQDKLTINKKFVRFFSVRHQKDPQAQFLNLKFVREKLNTHLQSEQAQPAQNLISIHLHIKPFDLILNRDVVTRLNFFLTNAKLQELAEAEGEMPNADTRRIERKIKNKLKKMMGYNTQFVINLLIENHSVAIPENTNILSSSYMIYYCDEFSIRTIDNSNIEPQALALEPTGQVGQSANFDFNCLGISFRYNNGIDTNDAFVLLDNFSFRSRITRGVVERDQKFLIHFHFVCQLSKFSLNFPSSIDNQFMKLLTTLHSLLVKQIEQQPQAPTEGDLLRKSSAPIPTPKRRKFSTQEEDLRLSKLPLEDAKHSKAPTPTDGNLPNVQLQLKQSQGPSMINTTNISNVSVAEEDEFVDAFESLTEYMEFEEKKMNEGVKKARKKMAKPITHKKADAEEKAINPLDFIQLSLELGIEEYNLNLCDFYKSTPEVVYSVFGSQTKLNFTKARTTIDLQFREASATLEGDLCRFEICKLSKSPELSNSPQQSNSTLAVIWEPLLNPEGSGSRLEIQYDQQPLEVMLKSECVPLLTQTLRNAGNTLQKILQLFKKPFLEDPKKDKPVTDNSEKILRINLRKMAFNLENEGRTLTFGLNNNKVAVKILNQSFEMRLITGEIGLQRTKREKIFKILRSTSLNDQNLSIVAVNDSRELIKKMAITLGHLEINFDYLKLFEACKIIQIYSQPIMNFLQRISIQTAPKPVDKISSKVIIPESITFEILNSELNAPYNTNLRGFEEKYWLNGYPFTIQRKAKTHLMTAKIGSLHTSKNGSSKQIVEEITLAFSNTHEKDPLSLEAKTIFCFKPLISVIIGEVRLRVLLSDVYLVTNVIESIIITIGELSNRISKQFSSNENQIKKSDEQSSNFKLSDCKPLLPNSYLDKFSEAIKENYEIGSLIIVKVANFKGEILLDHEEIIAESEDGTPYTGKESFERIALGSGNLGVTITTFKGDISSNILVEIEGLAHQAIDRTNIACVSDVTFAEKPFLQVLVSQHGTVVTINNLRTYVNELGLTMMLKFINNLTNLLDSLLPSSPPNPNPDPQAKPSSTTIVLNNNSICLFKVNQTEPSNTRRRKKISSKGQRGLAIATDSVSLEKPNPRYSRLIIDISAKLGLSSLHEEKEIKLQISSISVGLSSEKFKKLSQTKTLLHSASLKLDLLILKGQGLTDIGLAFNKEICIDYSQTYHAFLIQFLAFIQAAKSVYKKTRLPKGVEQQFEIVEAKKSRAFFEDPGFPAHISSKIPALYLTLLRGERTNDLKLREELQPLVNIELLNVVLDSKIQNRNQPQKPISNAILCELNAKVFLFNESNTYYEPVLENFEFTLQAILEQRQKDVNLSIKDKFLVNANIESWESMIKIVKELYGFTSKNPVPLVSPSPLKDQSSRNQAALTYFILKNDTGSSITYWLKPTNIEKLEAGGEGYIRNNMNLDIESDVAKMNNIFSYDDDETPKFVSFNLNKRSEGCYHGLSNSDRKIYMNTSYMRRLYVEIEGIKEVLSIDIEEEKQTKVKKTDLNNNPVEIVTEVTTTAEQGQKEISVHSNYLLVNKMSQPMVVRLHNIKKNQLEDIVLRENESKFVPLRFVSFDAVQCHLCELDEGLNQIVKSVGKGSSQSRVNRNSDRLLGTRVIVDRKNVKNSKTIDNYSLVTDPNSTR